MREIIFEEDGGYNTDMDVGTIDSGYVPLPQQPPPPEPTPPADQMPVRQSTPEPPPPPPEVENLERSVDIFV